MNKCVLTLLALLGRLVSLQSQDIPLFQTTFYFTDAVGNKDSCTIGFDPMATDGLDINFGEEALLEPFDSIFEVRATYMEGLWTFSKDHISKILIGDGEYESLFPAPFTNCFVGNRAIFLIKSKYPPVVISWDRNAFRQNLCISASSILLNRELLLLFPPYFIEKPNMTCLAVDSTYLFDDRKISRNIDFYFGLSYPSQGTPNDTIMGLCINFNHDYGGSPVACVDSANIFLPTHQVYPSNTTSHVRLIPNPSADYVKIVPLGDVSYKTWTLFSLDERLVQQGDTDNGPFAATIIDVRPLPPGIYLLRLRTVDGRFVGSRFVKH